LNAEAVAIAECKTPLPPFRTTRPTIELMPSINIHDLRHVIPRYHGQVIEPDVSFKYPDLAYLRLSASTLEIMGRNGYVQRFRIVWIRTHFGKHRAILVCGSCGAGAIRLFGHYGNYACRFCHRAVYASQKHNQFARPRLQAAKLRLTQLGGWPDIREPLPPKAKWKHKKRYQRLRNQVQVLETQANRTRFRKQIDIRTFAYHVGRW
jgi:hypothetical protein